MKGQSIELGPTLVYVAFGGILTHDLLDVNIWP